MRKTTSAIHAVTLAWFSTQFLVILKFSKLSWNISLSITGLKSPFNSQQTIWALKCVRERSNDSLKILEFTRICHGKLCKRNWVTKVVFLKQMLLKPGFHMIVQIVPITPVVSKYFEMIQTIGVIGSFHMIVSIASKARDAGSSAISLGPVSYTHLTLPTIYSV